MRVWLIRHGESESNAGATSADPVTIQLTALGQQQAEGIARTLAEPPALIVTSPFLRARQTARPTIERFPEVACEEWPVQEFTYLGDLHGLPTTGQEREQYVHAYWQRADPHYTNGGAESFASLLGRVDAFLKRLEEQRSEPIVVFTHGLFIRAVVWSLQTGITSADTETMRSFRRFANSHPVLNGATTELRYTDDGIRLS